MNLRQIQKRYRVFIEDSYEVETDPGKSKELWRYMELRGKYGHIYPYSERKFAVYLKSPTIYERLKRQGKWQKIQEGDTECVFLFDRPGLEFFAKLIQSRKKRIMSESERKRLTELSKKHSARGRKASIKARAAH